MELETTLRECIDILTIILHNSVLRGDEDISPVAVKLFHTKESFQGTMRK